MLFLYDFVLRLNISRSSSFYTCSIFFCFIFFSNHLSFIPLFNLSWKYYYSIFFFGMSLFLRGECMVYQLSRLTFRKFKSFAVEEWSHFTVCCVLCLICNYLYCCQISCFWYAWDCFQFFLSLENHSCYRILFHVCIFCSAQKTFRALFLFFMVL